VTAPTEVTPEARLVVLLERGRSIEVIKQAVGWSTFEVRECAAHHGYEFDKEGCPHPVVARRASAGRVAPNPAHQVPTPQPVREPAAAFVPSPAPAREAVVVRSSTRYDAVREAIPLPVPSPAAPQVEPGDTEAALARVVALLRRAQAHPARPVGVALRRVVRQLDDLEQALAHQDELAAADRVAERQRAAVLARLQAAEAALAKARDEARAAGVKVCLPAATADPASTRSRKTARKGIRAWARANGWPATADYGQLPAAVLVAYDAAHPADTLTPPTPT
jgi:hypothetical protein